MKNTHLPTIEESLTTSLAPLRAVSLPISHKESLRLELSAYADLHAVRPQTTSVRSPYAFIPVSFWRISAGLAVMLLFVGGSAYAASDALPGNPFYAVKVSVTEPIQTAFIPSTKGKAAWHAILAERRLEEATTLAVNGELDAKTQAQLTDNFNDNVQDSIEGAEALEDKGDLDGSLAVRSDLDARLTAHEDILGQVVDHLTSDGVATENDTAAQTLLAIVADTQDDIEDSRLALETSVTGGADADIDHGPLATKIAVTADVEDNAVLVGALPVDSSFATQIQTAQTARTLEVAAIMSKNAVLLSSLASTTAATTTATSTIETDTTATDMNSSSSESEEDIDQ